MGTLAAPASGVTVRMYRQGLGDCGTREQQGNQGEAAKHWQFSLRWIYRGIVR